MDLSDIKILTQPDGEFDISDDLRAVLAYLDDGRLFISKTHAFNPHVRAFIGRLDRLNKPYEVLHVDLAMIDAVYTGAYSNKQNVSDSDMQRAAKALFTKAVQDKASDIHIRVSKNHKTRVFFRIHNDLVFTEEHPYDYGEQLCSTIYQAMADVSDATFEPMSRQDARISKNGKIPEGLDGIRIATSPQTDGFLMVLRLLYNDATESTDLELLGFNAPQKDAVTLMKRRPTGIIIIGGPTGSGKSTTLQRVLTSVIRESEGRKHVITVEDPPEYPILNAVQTPVTNAGNEQERSEAYQLAIKAAMRLDPDVIMISEVRDTPTARSAVQAAMTGHQVWTTVHANSAFAIIDRLHDLGVPMELLSDPSIITGLVCQRLLKVLCPKCKKQISEVTDRYLRGDVERIMTIGNISSIYVRGDGCPDCKNSGTIGRTVVAETVTTDHLLMSFIRKGDRIGAIEYWRRDQEGKTMLDHAIAKVNAGLVDPFQAEDIVGPLNMGKIESDFRIHASEVTDAVGSRA